MRALIRKHNPQDEDDFAEYFKTSLFADRKQRSVVRGATWDPGVFLSEMKKQRARSPEDTKSYHKHYGLSDLDREVQILVARQKVCRDNLVICGSFQECQGWGPSTWIHAGLIPDIMERIILKRGDMGNTAPPMFILVIGGKLDARCFRSRAFTYLMHEGFHMNISIALVIPTTPHVNIYENCFIPIGMRNQARGVFQGSGVAVFHNFE